MKEINLKLLKLNKIFCLSILSFIFAFNNYSKDLFDFALYLYKENQYYRAISEFQRFIFYFPDDKRVPEASLYIAKSYFFGEQYDEVIRYSTNSLKNINDNRLKDKFYFYIASSYLLKNEYEKSLKIFKNLKDFSSDNTISEYSHYKLIWVFIFQHKWNEAFSEVLEFQKKRPESKLVNELKFLKDDLKPGINFKKISPTLSAIFSAIIPGAGQVYAKRPGDGIVAFIFVSALTYGSYYYYKNGPKEIFVGICFFNVLFYAGNIYTAFSSAHKYNNNFNLKLREKLYNYYYTEYDL